VPAGKRVFGKDPQKIVIFWTPDAHDVAIHEYSARLTARKVAAFYREAFFLWSVVLRLKR
jgi:hypothetical protein